MTRNMSTLDRRLRAFVVAPLLVVAALLVGAGTVPAILLFALAAVMLATSAVGYCPLYTLLRVTTARKTPLPH